MIEGGTHEIEKLKWTEAVVDAIINAEETDQIKCSPEDLLHILAAFDEIHHVNG